MGIFDAMNTSVGGLQAQSFALQNISGNIANSSTTGYKGIGTSFVDLIPDSSVPSKQVAGGVTANAKATITTQGTISSSTVATNMAITGDGFFSIQKASGVVAATSSAARHASRSRITADRPRDRPDGAENRSETAYSRRSLPVSTGVFY